MFRQWYMGAQWSTILCFKCGRCFCFQCWFKSLIASGKVMLKPSQQQQQSTSTSTQLNTVQPFFGIGPWVKHDVATTAAPSTTTVSIKKKVNIYNQKALPFPEAFSSRSSQKPTISARSSNPLNNNVRPSSNSPSASSLKPSASSSSSSPIEYGFTDSDYPYIIVKSSKVDSSSPEYRSDYYDESLNEPTSTPKPTSSSTSSYQGKGRKVLKCRTSDGRQLSDEQCKQQLAEKRSTMTSLAGKASQLSYLNQPIYRSSNNQDNEGNGESSEPKMSSKLGREEEGGKGRDEDDYRAKEEEKWSQGVREWNSDEFPSSSTEKSKPFGARSGRSSDYPSSPSSPSSPSPQGSSSDDDDHESTGDQLGVSYFADKGNTDEDKYYSAPDYNYREEGPKKKSATTSYGSSPPSPSKSKSGRSSSSSSASSSSSSSNPASESYDDYSDGPSEAPEGFTTSDSDEPSYQSDDSGYSKSSYDKSDKNDKKQSSEPSYNYRGSDEYLTSKSSKSSNPSNDGEPVQYYKPSQGYDDYAAEGRGQGGDEKHNDNEDNPPEEKKKRKSTEYKAEYKPDESYDENDDDSGSMDYGYNAKSGKDEGQSYDDKPRKNRSNEEEEFDAAFKEPLSGRGFNYHQQESRNVGKFANRQKHVKPNDSAKLTPSSSSSSSSLSLPSSPSMSLYTSSPSSQSTSPSTSFTPSFTSHKVNSRNYLKPRNGEKAFFVSQHF